ncbi:MAG TPA: class I SAM-dependent methyltransferase [Myxococcaceae bacterium]|nr:class I SAM-dependent methyltransferase [Myxococcaceae bacterium]
MTSVVPWWEQFFDENYLLLWAALSTPGDEEAAALWRILGLAEGCRLLDAGCGYGRVSLSLARLGARVLAVDQSAALLAEAERRRSDLDPGRLRFLRQDLRAPLAESGFDAALSLFSSLGYGTEADDAAILTTLAAAVRPGGRVVVDTNHRDVLAARLSREGSPAHRLPDGTLLFEERKFDPVAGRVETTWFWSGPRGSGQKTASIRVYTITELVRLMEGVGLRFQAALHPGSGAPFSPAGPLLGGRVLLVSESPSPGAPRPNAP